MPPTDTPTDLQRLAAVLASHAEALWTRLRHMRDSIGPPPRSRTRGASCPLCGAPLAETPVRAGEVLRWRRCIGCGLHQHGRVRP
jgi:hypothetical protein